MSDDRQQIQIQAAQIELVYRSSIRTVVGVCLVVLALAYLIAAHIPPLGPFSWAFAILAIYCYRMLIAHRALKARLDAEAMVKHSSLVAGVTTLMGVIAGGGLIMFFPSLPGETQALVTMICVGWIAGAVGVSGQYPRYIIPWFVAFGGSLVISWALHGATNRLLISLLLVLLIVYLWLAVKDIGHKTADSVRIRFENVDLMKALELRQRETEAASEAKSRFMAAASHDLRQPLMSINLMHARLLRATDPMEATRLANKLSTPVRTLESILDSLVEISRLDAGGVVPHPAQFSLPELADELLDEFMPRAEASAIVMPPAQASAIALRITASAADVVADRHLVARALRNLIDNAFKFTESGSVEVSIRAVGAGTLELTVTDTGRGIPCNELENIFKDYYQVDAGTRRPARGLGLGLAIVQRLVNLQGGTIDVNSSEGRGSTFRVVLHATRVEPLPNERAGPESHQEPARAKLQLLCVEDEPGIQDAISEWSANSDFRVFFASSGDEALAISRSLEQRPDAVVSDYRLPGPRNGLQVIAELRLRWSGIPAILLTGDADPAIATAADQANVVFIRKPVSAERLESEIFAMINI